MCIIKTNVELHQAIKKFQTIFPINYYLAYMIKYKTGNILEDESEALVNAVNCVGIMGSGIALQFKNAFPANYKAYREACAEKRVKLGQMFIYFNDDDPSFIINFPTKDHWKDKSKLVDIEQGLSALAETIKVLPIPSVAIPALGCGLGGLDWKDVKPLIEKMAHKLPDVEITVYEPHLGRSKL